MSGPGRKRFLRAVLALGSLGLALLAAEAVVRLAFHQSPADPAVEGSPWMEVRPEGVRLVPNTHRPISARINGREIRLDVNADGFRGPELSRGGGDERRVWFLGDSIIFGPGLEYEETIPARLSARLGPGFEVINAGVPGMSLEDEAGLLEEKIGLLGPDLVLIGFYLNDPVRSIILTEQYGDLGMTWVRAAAFLRARSALANWAWQTAALRRAIRARSLKTEWPGLFHRREWLDDRAVYDRIIALADDDFGAAWQDGNWPAAERRLRRMRDRIRGRGADLALIVFPVSLQVESRVADDYPQQRIKTIAAGLDIPVCDLLPGLKNFRGQPILYDQCHYTPAGADLVADRIRQWMKENGVGESGPP